MEITKERAIVKIIFWQQIALIIFILFLILALGVAVYDINTNLYFDFIEEYFFHVGSYISLGSLGTYSIYLLYSSLHALKNYKSKQEDLDLELAFRKQRHFWMIAPMVLIFLVCILIIMLILLTINLYI
jgi:hypothetical protein